MKFFAKPAKSQGLIVSLMFLLPFLVQCTYAKRQSDGIMPVPRELAVDEQVQLTRSIAERFKQDVPREVQYRAAGPFRFINTDRFLYMDRTDVGSVAFEMSTYGISQTELDPAAITKEVLLPRIEASLARTGLQADGEQFEAFHDEFVSSSGPSKGLSIDLEPRKTTKHVARAAVFRRTVNGVPIFGSELLIGLMPDGSIGRFRMHWPKIEDKVIKEAQNLEADVRLKRWVLPQMIRENDIEILEVAGGVGHSGFADPGFRAAPVVRVLYRKSSRDQQYPITSTSYKYFDAGGREVLFSAFAKIPGTPAEKKPS